MAARRQQPQQPQRDDAGPDYVDDDHAELVAFAEKWLPEETRGQFVDDFMENSGRYERVSGWRPRELDELDDGQGDDGQGDDGQGDDGQASPAPRQRPQRQRPRGGYFPRQ